MICLSARNALRGGGYAAVDITIQIKIKNIKNRYQCLRGRLDARDSLTACV